MISLWFVVPVHGREALTAVCLRQLKRTCDSAKEFGLEATAVVIGDDSSLEVAECLGFATVTRDNSQLGRKFNDGYQLACDPEFNPYPADFVVPCGSDDWIDPALLRTMPPGDTIGVFTQLAVVNEARDQLARLTVTGYAAGVGPRIIPRSLIEAARYRPAEEDRNRAIDGSTFRGIWQALGRRQPKTQQLDRHPLQIVDWKSPVNQLNSYDSLRGFRWEESPDPFGQLLSCYPADAIREMKQLT